ncbi:GNAT family N-acetyltransferase [Georgenia sp. H159]|uniref:GNAT family N-acetyltransferase n=1 Tax=Georgenia sp. H159 TaxID=3076115 RepID=UPI002D79E1C7|nr:GNAT family N-acetyltransferase [Georgenia sp. H159]
MTITHPPEVPLSAGYRLAELDDAADRDAIHDVDRWAFAFDLAPEDEAALVWTLEPGRSVGVWHDGPRGTTLAAVHSSYAFRLQVPGGGRIPAAGLTWVGVHPGHRRRGLGRAMLHAHLRRSRERGEVVSVLNAAESSIYGRYGYGVATHRTSATLGRGAGLRDVPGSTDLVVELETLDPQRHGDVVEHVHAQVVRPGWITRDTPALRADHLVDWPSARRGAERRRIAVVRGPAGEPFGYAVFRRKEKWSQENKPEGTVSVHDVLALDAASSRALWGALLDLDLMGSVEVHNLAPDDAGFGLLTELRGINRRLHDDVWLRVLDLPAVLRARAYAAPVDVVLDVSDPLIPDNAGRWHVRGGPGGVEVSRTDAAAHLALDVSDLASASLGGTTLAALAAAGRVTELAPGTLHPAAAAFGWPVAASTGWGF